jgi:hypothetical protein
MYFHLQLIDVSVMLSACAMLVSCLDYSLTPKMKVTYASETSVDFQRTTRRYIPEDTIILTCFTECPLSLCYVCQLYLIN